MLISLVVHGKDVFTFPLVFGLVAGVCAAFAYGNPGSRLGTFVFWSILWIVGLFILLGIGYVLTNPK